VRTIIKFLNKEVKGFLMLRGKQFGFSLIELMIVLAITVTLIMLVAPSFKSLIERRHLSGAAETFYADLYYAKSEAIKRSANITMDVTSGENWSYQITGPGAIGTLKTVTGTTYTNIQMSAGADSTFSSRQGMPGAAQNFTFRVGAAGDTKTIAVNAIGRIKLD